MAQLLASNTPELIDDSEDEELPYLAEGIELIGKYEGSGFRSAPYLVKRGDGQVIQVSELIYLVATAIDVCGDPDEVAARVSAAYGREVSADNIRYLVEKKLRPIGLLWSPHPGGEAPAPRANPLLALRLRLPLVPEPVHRGVTTALTPLFWPPVVVVALALVVALDIWLIAGLGFNVIAVAQALIYAPQLLLPLTVLTILMGLFHEIGHATASRYGGAKPGAMGAGIYLVWPVFYTDVTDSYRLDRRGRLRTDLGGVYFNAVFMLAVGALYLATGHVLFLVFIMLAHIETGRQFLPFVRFDGYYILSDLAGVPNLFSYMRPALTKAALFWRRGGQHAHRARPLDALTRRTQIVLVVWACVTGPILAFHIASLLIFLPEIAGAAWGSAGIQAGVMAEAIGQANLATATNAGIGIVFLALPTTGMGYIAVRRLARVPSAVQRWWDQRPTITAAVVTAASLAIVSQVSLVWPEKFTGAASEPGRERAEAEAAAAAVEARAWVSRGAGAVSDAVSRMTFGLAAPGTKPTPPAPPHTKPGPEAEGSDGAAVDPSDDQPVADDPVPSLDQPSVPASDTAPGAARPGTGDPPVTTPRRDPGQPGTTTPDQTPDATPPSTLPTLEDTVEDLLSVLLEGE